MTAQNGGNGRSGSTSSNGASPVLGEPSAKRSALATAKTLDGPTIGTSGGCGGGGGGGGRQRSNAIVDDAMSHGIITAIKRTMTTSTTMMMPSSHPPSYPMVAAVPQNMPIVATNPQNSLWPVPVPMRTMVVGEAATVHVATMAALGGGWCCTLTTTGWIRRRPSCHRPLRWDVSWLIPATLAMTTWTKARMRRHPRTRRDGRRTRSDEMPPSLCHLRPWLEMMRWQMKKRRRIARMKRKMRQVMTAKGVRKRLARPIPRRGCQPTRGLPETVQEVQGRARQPSLPHWHSQAGEVRRRIQT